MRRTYSNFDLSRGDLVGNGVDGGQSRRALTVNGSNGNSIGNTSIESCHTGRGRTTTRGKDVAYLDVLDQRRVEASFFVNTLEHSRKDLLGACILESTLLALCITLSSSHLH